MPLRFDATRSAVDNRLTRPSTTERGIAARGRQKRGMRNFPACNALKRHKTAK
jgi:hypothetical protein